MPNLDALEQEVNLLTKDPPSLPVRFETAYRHIVDALQTLTEQEKPKLSQILRTFRSEKLPNLVALNTVRRLARKLDEKLTTDTVGELLGAIRDRNRELTRLKASLQEQIDKGHRDAVLLGTIKAMLDQVTSTIDGIKDVVKNITDDNLKGAVTAALNTIAGLAAFSPDGPSSA